MFIKSGAMWMWNQHGECACTGLQIESQTLKPGGPALTDCSHDFAGAPSSEMLPSRAVTGVAHIGAPAAEGPVPASHLQGLNGTFSQLHRSHASVPVLAPAPISVIVSSTRLLSHPNPLLSASPAMTVCSAMDMTCTIA